MKKNNKISSFEKLLLGLVVAKTRIVKEPLRQGATCPQCGKGKLEYNGMLQLECPACGFSNGEAGGCT